MADIAHFAGLVAAEEHPSPVPYCDVVTTTTHKTLGGGRGGMIMCREEYAKKIDSARVPGPPGRPADAHDRGQGGDLQDRPVGPLPRAPAAHPRGRGDRWPRRWSSAGVNVLTGGTDVHLVLADLRDSELDGKQAEDRLHDDRHHREPQRGAVRPAPAGRVVGPPDRHAGARHARLPGGRLPRGGARDRRGAHRRVLGLAQDASSPSARARWPTGTRSTRSWPSPRSRSAIFDLEGIRLARDGREVLRDVSLSIPSGSTALLGPSGSGKSTLLRLLNRLADPDEGVVRFHGTDVRELDPLELRRRVGLVPQLPAPVPGTRGRQRAVRPAARGARGRSRAAGAAGGARRRPSSTATRRGCRWASSSG